MSKASADAWPSTRCTASAPTVASAVRSPIRSTTTASSPCRGGTVRRTASGFASRGVSDSTTCPTRTASPSRSSAATTRRRAQTARLIRRIPSPISAKRAGRRLSTRRPPVSRPSATVTARRRWLASARPRAPTRKPIWFRSWCAPGSAPTTWITARGSATHPRWWRCSKASDPARSRRRSPPARIPTSSSSPAATRPRTIRWQRPFSSRPPRPKR